MRDAGPQSSNGKGYAAANENSATQLRNVRAAVKKFHPEHVLIASVWLATFANAFALLLGGV